MPHGDPGTRANCETVMKPTQVIIGALLVILLIAGVWVVGFHSDWLKASPQEETEKPVDTDVPVKTAPIVRATLHRYVEGYGTVQPEPAFGGKPAASAAVAAPVAGLAAQVLCEPGQHVEQGAVLFQLDDRLAKAQEDQAAAGLESAKAALARIKATPRPEQLAVAELQVDKARAAADLAQKNFERQQQLAPQQVVSAKTLQQSESELNAARLDVRTAEKQLALLKASPTPEELAEAAAKVTEAERALAVARTQRDVLKIRAPLSGTVVHIAVNAGEAVDPTKPLAELVDLDRLILAAAISATEARSLKLAMPAEIYAADSPAPSGAGASTRASPATAPLSPSTAPAAIQSTVQWIGYEIDPKTDTIPLWVRAPSDARLRPGQYARVRIVAEEHPDRLAVPTESVVTNADGATVISIVKGDKAVQTPVQAGLRDRSLTEVEGEGLKEGDPVVTEGAYGLPKETKVHVIARQPSAD